MDQQQRYQMQSVAGTAGRNILKVTLVTGIQIFKAVAKFIGEMFHMAVGR